MCRTNIKIILVSAFIFFTAAYSQDQDNNPDTYAGAPEIGDTAVSMDKFKTELTPQGEWLTVDSNDVDTEGMTVDTNNTDNTDMDNADNDGYDDDVNPDICWRPYGVDYNWSPYQCGNWEYTDCGWMWNSCDPWGWYTDHYGRWWWSARWGWVWCPGYLWAPSWVSWRNCGDYCGWYPISPRIRCRGGHYRHDVSHYRFNHDHWTFVNKKNLTEKIDRTKIVQIDKNSDIMRKSRTVSNVFVSRENKVVNRGPNITEIEKTTGTKITPKDVSRYTDQNKRFVSKDSGRKNDTRDQADKTRYRDNTQKKRSNDNGYRPNKDNGRRNDGSRNHGTIGKRHNGNSNDGTKSRGNHSNGNGSRHSNGSSHSKGSKDGSSKGSRHSK